MDQKDSDWRPKPLPRRINSVRSSKDDDEEISKVLERKSIKKPPSPVLATPPDDTLFKVKDVPFRDKPENVPPLPPKPKSYINLLTCVPSPTSSSSSSDYYRNCGSHISLVDVDHNLNDLDKDLFSSNASTLSNGSRQTVGSSDDVNHAIHRTRVLDFYSSTASNDYFMKTNSFISYTSQNSLVNMDHNIFRTNRREENQLQRQDSYSSDDFDHKLTFKDNESYYDCLADLAKNKPNYFPFEDVLPGTSGPTRFEEAQSLILAAEDNFLKEYIEIGKNSSYYKIRDESRSAATKIFGAVTELLLFHTEFRQKLKDCTAVIELADIFIKNKEKLRLHIADQWKLCQCDGPHIMKNAAVFNTTFPTLSQQLIKTYREQMHLLCDNNNDINLVDNVKYANRILTHVYKQIVYINISLKHIIDPSVLLSECGDILFVNKFSAKYQSAFMWKWMEIYFMQKYIILTEMKNGKNFFIDSIPAHDLEFKASETKMTITIYSKQHDRKKLLAIRIQKDKVSEFQTVKSILYHMHEDGFDLLI